MKQIHFSRKKRQLARLADELKQAIENKAEQVISLIKMKIHLLLKDLAGNVSKHQLKGILGALAIFFGMGMANDTQAQSYLAPVANPFSLQPVANQLSLPEFVDLDGDGDFDLLSGGLGDSYYGTGKAPIYFYENTGNANNPSFAAPVTNPFGLDSTNYLALMTSADLDGDGDMDLLVGEYYGNIKYFQNTGTLSAPQFAAPVELPFGLTSGNYLAIPELVDLDDDGDVDLLIVEYYGVLKYAENTGTATNPSFAAPVTNPFGLAANSGGVLPDFEDFDNDGDLDLLLGGYNDSTSAIYYYENTGTKSSPAFAAPVANPMGFQAITYSTAYTAIADLDNDGDIDILAGHYEGDDFMYYEFGFPIGIAEEQFASKLYPNPTSNILNVESDKTIVKVEVIDLTGRLVIQSNNFNNKLDVSDLSSGMYIISLTDVDDAKSVQKFTKK